MEDQSKTEQELIKEISDLKQRIKELEQSSSGCTRVEEVLESSLSLLSASLESTGDGILIVDRKGKIVRWNQKFADMWKLPEEVLSSRDDGKALKYILTQLADPEQIVAKVRKLYEHPEESSFDQIEFTDGRVFERYSQPQRIRDTIIGRVWSFRDITERMRAENLLRQEHELYLDLVNNQPAGIYRIRVYPREQWRKDAWINPEHPPYSVDLASNRFCEILGINRQVFETNPGIVEDLIYPEDKEDFTRRNEEANAEMVLFQWEGRLFIRGEILWVHFESIPRLIDNGVVLWTGILYDISDRKRAEDALRESEETYKTILMASPDDITIADLSGRVIMVSEASNKMFGYDQEEGPGMSVMDFIAPEEHERARANIVRMLTENYPGPNEYRAIRKDRSCFDIEVNNALIRDRQGNPIRMVLIARDITDRKRMQEELLSLSLTDHLTGLHNRRGFLSLAEQQFKVSIRRKTGMLLFFADLDGLKWINDTLGHEEGDKALIEAATVLKETFRASDIIARLGGDEYAALTVDISKVNYKVFTDRLQSLIDIRNNHGNWRYKLSISVGCSRYDPENPCSIEELMASADNLMYEQKQNKKGLLLEGASLSSSIK
jgi:diguanylate cyclase (GGDEF)-like protein/PAS domain S-box-containing protein